MRALQQAWLHSPRAGESERRSAPRCDAHLEARLLFSLSLQGTDEGERATVLPSLLEGHTRNLSETGLALVVPSLHFGGRYLNVVGSTLHVMLELPTGTVRIRATPVRCERLGEKDEETGYLVGVRITEMNDSEWVKLVQYVRRLR
ncbi:MAG TPA: PilZ domain-containing protein [Pyrinomonadaceae bacterium]